MDDCDFLPQIIDMIMGIFFPSENSPPFKVNNLLKNYLLAETGDYDSAEDAE